MLFRSQARYFSGKALFLDTPEPRLDQSSTYKAIQEIADFTNGKDFTTCDIAKHILAEEEEHEQDLQDYLTDIARMKKSFLDK